MKNMVNKIKNVIYVQPLEDSINEEFVKQL